MTSDDAATAPSTPEGPVRDVDLATLKALSHPLRVRLWDLLVSTGPATSTTLAKETGESTGSTSYHLRQLAGHGLVEEVPDRGTGRERWWRAAPGMLRFRGEGEDQSPSAAEALRAFGSQWGELRQGSVERFYARAEPTEWLDASSDSTSFAYLTRDELHALSRELEEVLEKHTKGRRRLDEPPGPGYRRIEVQVRAFPVSTDGPSGA